jgi:Mn2+/Fe2+ NRAMP family transporter
LAKKFADAQFAGSKRDSFRQTRLGFWRKMLAFSGPGYMVAVGYMDPGIEIRGL